MTSPESALTVAYISIGSNMNAEANLRSAVAMLRERCAVVALSSVYQSPAFGWENQPDFLDICAKIRTALSPADFKTTVLDAIETAHGRDRDSQQSKYGPLPLDMDILLWGDAAFEYGDKPWRVPDKGILKYAAVAIPLADIAGDVHHPTDGATITEIVARFAPNDRAAVRQTAIRL